MLEANPLLTLLGRRGRGAVIEALRRAPARTWTVRDLARTADVPPMVASRTVRELVALGAANVQRPGRDARVRFNATSSAGRVLAALNVPDLRAGASDVFARALRAPRGSVVVEWQQPGDDRADPRTPTRVAVLVARDVDEDAALDAVGAALDAVRTAGFAAPDASVWVRSSLDGGDAVAQAILAGRPLGRTTNG